MTGQEFEYGVDDIENRKVARRGGDENGWNLRESLYTPNLLNQYSNRTVPGFADVVGVALATKPVYVNGQMASRKGEYFRRELSVNNAMAPVWQSVTVTASGEPTVTGNLFVPRTPEVFTHDPDGNLTSDGRWTYTWDAENRLIRVQSRSDTPQASWRRVEWQYDALGRRIRQTTWSWLVQSNLWEVTEDLKFVSDPLFFGRHIVELNATNNAFVRSYVWGLDLSGTMDGAGGVGGLLWVTLYTATGPATGAHFAAYDGNGNVVALLSATTGTETAWYEYGPFAEPICVTGPAASRNSFRFSTKRTDNTTDLVLYEYRPYIPSLGRWPSRDPIGENGGRNLYGFVANDPLDYIDTDGRFMGTKCSVCGEWYQGFHNCKGPRLPPDPVGFAICYRDLDAADCCEKILYAIIGGIFGREHTYVHYKECKNCKTKGLGTGKVKGKKPLSEKRFEPNECVPCVRTDSKLEFGNEDGGKGKKGTEATDAEIWDCISNVPASKDYNPWPGKEQYHCEHWAKEAVSKCGLICK